MLKPSLISGAFGLIALTLLLLPFLGCREAPIQGAVGKPSQSMKDIKATRAKLGDIRSLLESRKPLDEAALKQLAAAVREDDFTNAVVALLLVSMAHDAGHISLDEAKDLHRYRLGREEAVRSLIVARGVESLLIEGRHADKAAYDELAELIKAGASSTKFTEEERDYLRRKVGSREKGDAILATELLLAKKRGEGDSFAILTLDEIIRHQSGGIKEFAAFARSVIAGDQ